MCHASDILTSDILTSVHAFLPQNSGNGFSNTLGLMAQASHYVSSASSSDLEISSSHLVLVVADALAVRTVNRELVIIIPDFTSIC
jgi:hypothetical protein